MIDRYRGALIGTAVGDALGAPVEGHPSPLDYVATLDKGDPNLRFTDDTAMTIALTESLVAKGGFDGTHMALTFARHYAAEPWRGYGASPPQVFHRLEKGAPWDEAAASLFGGTGSYGNGAAMRVAPVALFAHPDTDAIALLAKNTAIITHTHPEGIDGAVCQAVAISRLLDHNPDDTLEPVELIEEILPHLTTAAFRDKLTQVVTSVGASDPHELGRKLGSGISAPTSVPTALACFLTYPRSFSDAVKTAISLGGDTDTIAAMTGALTGAHLGVDAIPEPWRNVEGHQTLRRLADQLHSGHAAH